MVLQYKCPDCGADMSFDTESGKLKCQSCGKLIDIDSMQKQGNGDYHQEKSSQDVDEVYGDYEDFQEQSNYTTYTGNETVAYHCENCGAELITNAETTATSCSYCGAPVVLGDRLTGNMAPAKVLPFTISKEQAEKAFRKWCGKGLVTPKGFMTADRVKSITGMYVPFWLYDVNGRGEASATATRVSHYTQGDYEVTGTSYYDVYRKVDLNFENIPVDASEKMPDDMMDKLEPFPFNNLKDFNTPYLSGYIAENYNYTDKELFPRLNKKTSAFIDQYISSTITGYDTVNYHFKNLDAKQRRSSYTLLPVWMLAYDYQGKEYMFAMNGQTGKVVGKPPISKGKCFLWFLLYTIIAFILTHIIIGLNGGAF